MEKRIRVLIVDDHPVVRKGMRALLSEIDDIQTIGEASDGQQAIDAYEKLRPDVVLMDLIMPKVDGIQAISTITNRHQDARILVLTSFTGDDKVFPAIKAGALGYLLKETNAGDLVDAIRQVHRGEPSLHPEIARKMLMELSGRTPPKPFEEPITEPLTDREIEVLRLVAKGMSNQEIAELLSIAEVTVRTHIGRILSKLHLANRVQATLYALREGLASLQDE